MHIRRFDAGFTRRHFLDQIARGVVTAGVLAPLWPAIAAKGTADAAFPDELLSIEAYTKGKLAPGKDIDAGNVDLVADLLDPIQIAQIRTMGRRLRLAPETKDVMRLSPWEYMEATLRNAGKARFDANGNVVNEDGRPWIGGNPFPATTNGLEAFAGLTLSWGRHDSCVYAIKECDVGTKGDVDYRYEAIWAEMSPVARVAMDPRPYLEGDEDKLRYQSIFFMSPDDVRGGSFLNIWPYDQREFPDLFGYVPTFKRIRRYPTNQRFEPMLPGSDLYLSDAWAAGDPFLTWGNYKVVATGPALAPLSGNWSSARENWQVPTHGGARGNTFYDTAVELVPQTITVEAEPVKFPRAPVSKKQVRFDLRTMLPIGMISFDRRGDLFRSFDGAYSLYDDGSSRVMDGQHPYWSWTHVHAYNVQTGRMTRIEQVAKLSSGDRMRVNDQEIYDLYLNQGAMQRRGR
ncbi:DUF1329 domain-containing protein [Zavarzinia aquatilis]|uniref:DUF1329 domain-containing protein n=1 Tax=Zavarzinia aquatilis TaxID=2211142 RepID=A0A317EDY3_9PROT|nr:DUF1329 domain-containing protein [Zavarzinia aquatilis]PWR25247.1 hypothetical protein DKG74_05655 [Zavarzinia aquatilis]